MRKSRTLKLAAGAIALALVLAACGGDDDDSGSTTTQAPTTQAPTTSGEGETKDIVDVAVAAGTFKTLATLLTEADLVETLKGEGPFTVFAPTDEAFAAVDPATLDALKADPEQLKTVLTYHVIAGAKVMSADVTTGEVDTVAGIKLPIEVKDGEVLVGDGGAKVIKADVEALNGVIHVIDAVLIPPAS